MRVRSVKGNRNVSRLTTYVYDKRDGLPNKDHGAGYSGDLYVVRGIASECYFNLNAMMVHAQMMSLLSMRSVVWNPRRDVL